MTSRQKLLTKFVAVIILALAVGLISYPKAVKFLPPIYDRLNKLKINLGLDLQGGIHLEYKADTSQIDSVKIDEAMQALQDVIERRVNAFGVSEPVIYTTKTGSERRLVVELAGVRDINQAKSIIKETPFLEFKEEGAPDESKQVSREVLDQLNTQAKQKAGDILKKALSPPAGGGEDFTQLAKDNSEDPGSKESGGDLGFVKKEAFVPAFDTVLFDSSFQDGTVWPNLVESDFGWHIIKKIEQRGEGDTLEIHSAHILIAKKSNPAPQANWSATGLTGKNLTNATADFQNQGLTEPVVSIQFDSDGTKLFADLTKKNLDKQIAIFLDGQLISAPTVQAEITDGRAIISGNFTVESAKDLARRLNEGALPVPINDPIRQESVESSLGQLSLEKSLKAGMIGFIIVVIFMIIYYRFLGVVASFALLIYAGLMISIFKLSALSPWQITLTLPGIAGFILSIGMAVDANILIFERTKEEIRRGRNILGALDEGFKRAWTSIRDGNVSSIITAVILIEMGTGFVKGFAITLVVGVLLSMFTAVNITRTLLKVLVGEWISDKLWMVGVNNKEIKKS